MKFKTMKSWDEALFVVVVVVTMREFFYFFISLLCTYLTSCIILFTEKPFKECTIKFYLLT